MLEHVTKCNPNGSIIINCKNKKKINIIQIEGIKNHQICNLEKVSKKELSSFPLS